VFLYDVYFDSVKPCEEFKFQEIQGTNSLSDFFYKSFKNYGSNTSERKNNESGTSNTANLFISNI